MKDQDRLDLIEALEAAIQHVRAGLDPADIELLRDLGYEKPEKKR
jgi:hypothetical protein